MWRLYAKNISPFITGKGAYKEPKVSSEEINSLIKFYRDTEPEIKSFFLKVSKVYDPMRLKIPKFDLESINQEFEITKELLSKYAVPDVSGGFILKSTLDTEDGDLEYCDSYSSGIQKEGVVSAAKVIEQNQKEDDEEEGEDENDDDGDGDEAIEEEGEEKKKGEEEEEDENENENDHEGEEKDDDEEDDDNKELKEDETEEDKSEEEIEE